MAKAPPPPPTRRQRGFEPAFGLVSGQVRRAGESRGFAVARLVTHWAEIAGEDFARCTHPVRVSHGREGMGMGGTLTVLVQGAMAPQVEMQKERLRARVNAVYGYNAISRILLTQTSASGFAEGQAAFAGPAAAAPPPPDPALSQRAAEAARDVADADLKAALERLGQNILSRRKTEKGMT